MWLIVEMNIVNVKKFESSNARMAHNKTVDPVKER